jgi:serine/threonine protein phosphatase PrpC
MSKKTMVACLLMILSTISWAMDTVPACNDDQPAIVVVYCKNKEDKAYEDRWMYEYSPNKGHMVGVFDGHCGSQTSHCLSTTLFSLVAEQKGDDACANISEALLNADTNVKCFTSGSTAVVAGILNGKCHFANVGDSRAALGRIAPEGKYTVSFFTKDHVPAVLTKNGEWNLTNEGYRVLRAGGLISTDFYVYADSELSDGLAMTRSIGDRDEDPEKKVILAVPECTTCDISDISNEGYLVLGSDGLWDYLSQADNVSEHDFSEYAFSKISRGVAANNSLADIGVSMVEDAVRKCSTDDITCMLVKIKALMENKKATVKLIQVVEQKKQIDTACDMF